MGVDSIQAKAAVATQKVQQSAPPAPAPAPAQAPAPAPAPKQLVATDQFMAPKKSSSAKVVLEPLPTQTLSDPKNTASQTVSLSELVRTQASWAKTQASTSASGSNLVLTEAKTTEAVTTSDPAAAAKRAEEDYNSARFAAQFTNPNAHQANLVKNVNDPAYQSRYIELLNQNGELAAEADKAFNVNPSLSTTPGYKPGGLTVGVSNSTAFTSALQAARGKTISDDEIRGLAQKSDGMYFAAKKLSPPIDASCEAPSVMKTRELETTTTNYNNARAEVDKLNQQLAAELSAVGPALSDEQRAEYTRRFKEKHGPAYQAETHTAEALAKALEGTDPSDPRLAGKLYTGYQALAQGPLADKAAGFVDRLQGDPALRGQYAKALNLTPAQFDQKLNDEIRDEAIATMMTNALALKPNAKEAEEEFLKGLENFKNIKEHLGDGGIEGIKKTFAALIEYEVIGDHQAIARLAKDTDGLGHLGKTLDGVMALAGLKIANEKRKEGDYIAMAKEAFGSAEDATKLFADATKRFSNVAKLQQAGNFAAKAAPWLGLAANTASFFSHLEGAKKGSTALAVAAMGDAVAIAGSALNTTGVGAVFGEPLVALGTIISTGGELWHNFSEEQRGKNEQKEILAAMGIKRPEVLADNRENIERLKSTGLSPEQIQRIADRYPEALIGSYNPSLVEVINSYNLAGENVVTFLDKLNTEALAKQQNLGVAMQSLPAPSKSRSPEEWRQGLEGGYKQTAQWARGLNLYGGQTAPQPTVTSTGDR